jgi:hypothetical protein
MMQQINDLLDVKIIEKRKSQEKRNYLGASMLGDDCIRKIQLQYMKHEIDVSLRGCYRRTAQNLRTFDIGHCLENLIFSYFKSC